MSTTPKTFNVKPMTAEQIRAAVGVTAEDRALVASVSSPRTWPEFLAKWQPLGFAPDCFSQVGPGWVPIVDRLFEKLKMYSLVGSVVQVKQKFGGLRVYFSGSVFESERAAIAEAEAACGNTCEFCGKEGRVREGGWILVLCDSCEANREHR